MVNFLKLSCNKLFSERWMCLKASKAHELSDCFMLGTVSCAWLMKHCLSPHPVCFYLLNTEGPEQSWHLIKKLDVVS